MTVTAAALAAGLAAGLVARALVPPRLRLRDRMAPYVESSGSGIGASARSSQLLRSSPLVTGFRRVLWPPLVAVAQRVGVLLDSSSDEAVELRLRQAGLFSTASAHGRVVEYRLRQLAAIVGGGAAALLVGAVLDIGGLLRIVLFVLGLVWGASLWRGRVGAAIEERRSRLRIELATVDQLLAMRIRVGGGVITAVRQTVERGRGVAVNDLAEALRLHRSGMTAATSFRRIAELSPEPHAKRLYSLLATAEERGSDLAAALLALSRDVRDDRRDALKRAATKRRAAMLLPIVALLAPILIMFIAAPLPWIIFGELR